MSALFKRTTAK